jgi:hypothetical protein
MKTDIQNLSASFAEIFNSNTRDNNEIYYFINDKESHSELTDFIRDDIHQGYLPDDFKYKTVYYFLEAIAEGNTEFDQALDYVGVDHNNHELLKWVNSNLNRMDYINQVLQESEINDFGQLLSAGQYLEVEEICSQTYQFLENQLELLSENEEELENE